MTINYYRTDLTIFTVLVGDDIYSAINSLPSSSSSDIVLYQSGAITANGQAYADAIPFGEIPIVGIKLTDEEFYPYTLQIMLAYGLLVTIKDIRISQTTYYPLTGYEPKTTYVKTNGACALEYDTFSSEYITNTIPYGKLGRYTGTALDDFEVHVLYTNSDMSRWGILFISANPSIGGQVLGNHRTISSGYANNLLDYFTGVEPIVISSDPFAPGGESDTGGGTGNFDGTSVDIDFASLPTLSAVDTGFITLYNPSLAQLQSLASYMWSGLFDLDTFKKLFADPMQAILGLSIIPGPVPSGATQNVRIGNIDSGVAMTKAGTQYIDIDCGTLNVEEFWGAYLDYEPYTKAEIFLPFIGVHQIAIDDIMNKSVHIKYHIDLLSGGCACEIKCGGSVLYTFIGSCAVSIPVTGSDWTNLINGVLSAASAIGTMVATGGASAPAAASTIASAAVNSLKPSIEKSGSVAGAGGLLAGKVPVLILTRPRQALPTNQNAYTGYPAFITRSLGALSGYTEVHSIRLSGIDGTESEIDEIEELLKGGVIL